MFLVLTYIRYRNRDDVKYAHVFLMLKYIRHRQKDDV